MKYKRFSKEVHSFIQRVEKTPFICFKAEECCWWLIVNLSWVSSVVRVECQNLMKIRDLLSREFHIFTFIILCIFKGGSQKPGNFIGPLR
jgi:hypothetical protein